MCVTVSHEVCVTPRLHYSLHVFIEIPRKITERSMFDLSIVSASFTCFSALGDPIVRAKSRYAARARNGEGGFSL